MSEKSEALRLAEYHECATDLHSMQTAAELRRLHELALEQQGKIYALEMARSMEQKTAKLKRDALLRALKSTGLFLHHCWCDVQMNDYSFEKLNRQMEIVDAAIKSVEETE